MFNQYDINFISYLFHSGINELLNNQQYLFCNKMQASRVARSEAYRGDSPNHSYLDSHSKNINKQTIPTTAPKKNISPSSDKHKDKQISSKEISFDEKSNSIEEIRIAGMQKLLYIKKCRQRGIERQEMFKNYPFSKMSSFEFKLDEIKDQNGQFTAVVIQDSSGIHFVQHYKQPTQSKYTTINQQGKGKLNGVAVSILKDGTIFEGFYHDSHYCGLGYQIQNSGNTYIGTFKQGEKNGSGTYFWFSNSQIYSGQWRGGLPHGQGIYIGSGHEEKYEGTFSNGLKYGFGTETFANGDKYQGQYVNGVAQGYGQYQWADGSAYKGDFKHGVRHGYGVWKDNNEIYQGNYRMDKKQGFGMYKWIGKQIYKGEFKDDFRDGYGELFSINKLQKQLLLYKGCWSRGKKNDQLKPDQATIKCFYTFLDESFKINKELEEMHQKNHSKGRIGHRNCIPQESSLNKK